MAILLQKIVASVIQFTMCVFPFYFNPPHFAWVGEMGVGETGEDEIAPIRIHMFG